MKTHEDDASLAPPAQPDLEPRSPSASLPLAAPHDILGLPGQPDVRASHIELALEIKDLAGSATTETPNQSFAAIARDIADTVEDNSPASRSTAAETRPKDADRSSVYLRTSKRRRRRINHSTRVTVTQVVAIVLLLVVGLAAEYEFVARGHANSSNTTAQIVPTVPVAHLPTVALTPVRGSVFHFATSGSALSAPFRVTRSFAVVVSARCSPVTGATSVDVVVKSGGRQAANIFVPVRAAGTHQAISTTLGPGTYQVMAHTSGICSWSAPGMARP